MDPLLFLIHLDGILKKTKNELMFHTRDPWSRTFITCHCLWHEELKVFGRQTTDDVFCSLLVKFAYLANEKDEWVPATDALCIPAPPELRARQNRDMRASIRRSYCD